MTQIWAHRGASAEAPENTLAAFRRAAKIGAGGVELDVHLLADGTVVVIHDETFERTTTGHGPVREATLDQLRAWHAHDLANPAGPPAERTSDRPKDSSHPIPTLDEVLQELAPTQLVINIELKTDAVEQPDLPAAALDIVLQGGFEERVWWSSFNPHTMQQMRRLAPTAQLGLLHSGPVDWSLATDFGVQAIHPEHTLVDGVLMRRADAHNLRVHTWTVNDPARMKELAALGVDAVITDDPRSAREVLGDQISR